MSPDDDAVTIDDAREQAAFGAGFDGPAEKPTAKTDDAAAVDAPRVKKPDAPEYVQITAKDLAEIRAAAAKTASYDQQFSKLFGTTGKLQQLLKEAHAKETASPPKKFSLPDTAFAEMAKDFPELAQQNKAALEEVFSSLPVTGASDAVVAEIKSAMLAKIAEREIEALEDAHPDWRAVVGAVDVSKEQPDPNNPFRKWLAGKDDAYQNRVNSTESATVIARAIQRFQNETKAATRTTGTPRDAVRAERIQAAVQPRGDGGVPTSSNTREDAFAAGFGR